MRLQLLPLLALSIASCSSPIGIKGGMLYGNWRSPTAQVDAWDQFVTVRQGDFAGDTDGPVFPDLVGRFAARGFWVPRATPEQPNTQHLLRRVRFRGILDVRTGRLLMIVTDSATGEQYVADDLERTPPPPPPASPPPPAP